MVFLFDLFANFRSWPHHLKRHFKVSNSEITQFFVSGFVIALVVFFFVWRTKDFTSLSDGLSNLLLILINSLLFMFIYVFGSKAIAIFYWYTAKYTYWLNGLLVGFVISFVSYGFLPIAFPGKIEVSIIERLRHGRVFPGENKEEIFKILTKTLILMIFLTVIFKQLFVLTNFTFFKYSYIMGATISLMAILPFPDNLGSHLFYVSRNGFYIWFFFLILFYISTLFFARSYWFLVLIIAAIITSLFNLINPIEKH